MIEDTCFLMVFLNIRAISAFEGVNDFVFYGAKTTFKLRFPHNSTVL